MSDAISNLPLRPEATVPTQIESEPLDLDDELHAISTLCAELEPLSDDARARALVYTMLVLGFVPTVDLLEQACAREPREGVA